MIGVATHTAEESGLPSANQAIDFVTRRSEVSRARSAVGVALVAVGFFAAAVAPIDPAAAAVTPAAVIDGPDSGVEDLGGVAMSEDGTAGVVYRKLVGGRLHVFAAVYRNGIWEQPQRVDSGQQFDSSWPRIGAADGGRLVVTWVQEFGKKSDRMYSATIDPGSRLFEDPVPVDLDIEDSDGTFPALAMNRNGAAYLVYRVVTNPGPDPQRLPPGYVEGDLRVARYNGWTWSRLDLPADRNPSAFIREPGPSNVPQISVDVFGNGIVAFQEPDDEFIDRIWARRIFGSSFGLPMLVSPQQFAGSPLRGPADLPVLAANPFGAAVVCFRQQPGEQSRLGSTSLFANSLPDAFSATAFQFAGSRLVASDPTVASIDAAIDRRARFMLAYSSDSVTATALGDEQSIDAPQPVGFGMAGGVAGAQVALSARQRTVAIFKQREGPYESVVVREGGNQPDATSTPALVSAETSSALLSAASPSADAVYALRSGPRASGTVVVGTVDAPPESFNLHQSDDWQRSRRFEMTWDPAVNVIGLVTYEVFVDGISRAANLVPRQTISGLRDGRHRLVVVATDRLGQQSVGKGSVSVDRRKPRVKIRRLSTRRLAAKIDDAKKIRSAGLKKSSLIVNWGDGTRSSRRPTMAHRYAKSGRYLVVVRAVDKAGNRTVVKRRISVG